MRRSIPLCNVPGNHGVGNEPTPQAIAAYRERFGPDHYTFRAGDFAGSAPAKAPLEAATQQERLRVELGKARAAAARHLVVLQHHSWFLVDPEEKDHYFNLPVERRRP